jgi:hypothetical protein
MNTPTCRERRLRHPLFKRVFFFMRTGPSRCAWEATLLYDGKYPVEMFCPNCGNHKWRWVNAYLHKESSGPWYLGRHPNRRIMERRA